jgi:hypothetical protein
MNSRRVGLTASFLLLAAGGLAACDSDEPPNEDGHFYCTDANGNVVDEDLCDDSDGSGGGGGFFFMYMGSSMHAPPAGYSSYPVGSKLPSNAPKFSVNDKAARAKFGLPASGKVSNGTVKTNVVGKGGAGSSVKAPSGGG